MEILLDKAKNHELSIVAYLVNEYLIDEVDSRIASGILDATSLPLLVNDFLVKLVMSNNKLEKVTQINYETTFLMETDPDYNIGHIPVGSAVTKDNVDWDKVHVARLKPDGDIYFHTYIHHTLYRHFMFWDSLGVPEEAKENGFLDELIRFPVNVYIEKYNLPLLKYVDKIKILTDANWPPVSGFYPYVFYSDLEALKSAVVEPDTIENIISQVYTEDRWAHNIALWTVEEYFFGRERYIKLAVEKFLEGDYASCIYIIAPQIEGVIVEYLNNLGLKSDDGFKNCIDRVKDLVYKRKIIFYDRPVFDIMFQFIKEGGF